MRFNVIAVSSLLWIVTVQATPTGNHTCTGVVKHSVTVRVNVTEPVTYRTYTWCLRVPPRCSKYTVELKDRVKINTEMHNRTITVCCKGYVEIDYKCVPACPPQAECPNMHCNRTNHCYCTPGYQGLYCNYPCDRGFWGVECKKACDCPDGYTCHHLTGDCMIDDRPQLTTKYRRTTTTTVATLSPETTFAGNTATSTTTATPNPKTIFARTIPTSTTVTTPNTETTFAGTTPTTTTTPNVETTFPGTTAASTTVTTPSPKTTTEPSAETSTVSRTTVETTTVAPVSSTKRSNIVIALPETIPTTTTVTTTTRQSTPETRTHPTSNVEHSTSPHYVTEFPITVNPTLQSIITKEPRTETILTSTEEFTRQFFLSSTPLLTTESSTTTELSFKEGHPVPFTPLLIEKEKTTQNTPMTTAPDQVETRPPSLVNNTSETLLPEAPIIVSTNPSTLSTHTTSAVPVLTSVFSTEPTASTSKLTTSEVPLSTTPVTIQHPDTEIKYPPLSTAPTIISTIPTTTSTTPTMSATINYSTQETVSSTATFTAPHKNNLTKIESSATQPNMTPTKSIFSSKEDNLDTSTNFYFIPTQSQTSTPAVRESVEDEQTTIFTKTIPSYIEETTPTLISTTSLPKPLLPYSVVNLSTPDILPETLITEGNIGRMETTKSSEINVTIKVHPILIDFQVNEEAEAFNIFNESRTEVIKLGETVKTIETMESKKVSEPLSNDVLNKEIVKNDTTVASYINSPTTPYLLDKFSTVSEPTQLSTYTFNKPSIEKAIFVDSETKKNSTELENFATDSFSLTNNTNVPNAETTENLKYEENFKMPNTIKKAHKNGTNLNSSVNEVSTKFGQQNFDLSKPVSEIKLKQKQELSTTLTSTEDSSMRNDLRLTTNSRPAHTWYSHVKEYQRKAVKNKEDMKLSKTTSHLDLLSVTEKYDMSEESNIIDSMQTSYTERGSRGQSYAPPMVNEEENIASTYIRHGQMKYNLSSALAEEVQAGRRENSLFTLYSTSTLITGIALILLISTSTALWFCLRRKRETSTLRGPCIMAYGPPNEFTLSPLMYETVYPLDPMEGEQCSDPEIFFCPTFTNNYAEKINRELSELNYDHPRNSICEPLYAEIRY